MWDGGVDPNDTGARREISSNLETQHSDGLSRRVTTLEQIKLGMCEPQRRSSFDLRPISYHIHHQTHSLSTPAQSDGYPDGLGLGPSDGHLGRTSFKRPLKDPLDGSQILSTIDNQLLSRKVNCRARDDNNRSANQRKGTPRTPVPPSSDSRQWSPSYSIPI